MTTQSVLTPTAQDRERSPFFQKLRQFSDRTIIIFIIVLAVCLRLASAILQGNQVVDLPGIYDQISYHSLAQRVVDGYGLSFAENHWPATRAGESTAHWSYLYTLYLVVVYKLFGMYPLVARLIQALVAGVFQTLLFWRIGSRLFNPTVGLLAAALNAIYIYFFYYAGALITETFYITGILWTFDSALRLFASAKGGKQIVWLQWIELGLALGITVLLRQVFLLFLPFLFLWLWWNIRDTEAGKWSRRLHGSAIQGLCVAMVVLFLMIVPFTIRNYRTFGTFVLLNTNAGYAFFWANHPIHGVRFIPILPSKDYHDLVPVELLTLNEAELDQALLSRGLQIVTDDPKRFLLLSLSRTREFFKYWPSADSHLLSNISRVGSFGISLPFILYGLWVSVTNAWKSKGTAYRWQVSLLFLFIFVYTAIHLLSWALIRYRLPIDAFLLIFAALGIQTLVVDSGRRNRGDGYQLSRVKEDGL